jgi:hypothetical protein
MFSFEFISHVRSSVPYFFTIFHALMMITCEKPIQKYAQNNPTMMEMFIFFLIGMGHVVVVVEYLFYQK